MSTSAEPPPTPAEPRPAFADLPVAERARLLRPLTVPVLISAVANLIAGYAWFFTTCIGIFLTAPMLVLGAFELYYFLQAPRMPPRALERRTTALGIFEILLGVFNLVSLICGVLVLVQVNRLRSELLAGIDPDETSAP